MRNRSSPWYVRIGQRPLFSDTRLLHRPFKVFRFHPIPVINAQTLLVATTRDAFIDYAATKGFDETEQTIRLNNAVRAFCDIENDDDLGDVIALSATMWELVDVFSGLECSAIEGADEAESESEVEDDADSYRPKPSSKRQKAASKSGKKRPRAAGKNDGGNSKRGNVAAEESETEDEPRIQLNLGLLFKPL